MPPKETPAEIEKQKKLFEQLLKVRESKSIELKPSKMLRETIIGFDGQPQPLRLRYYQSQGIFHLLVVPRMVLGDGTGLGKCEKKGTLILSSEGLVPIESFYHSSSPLSESTAEGFFPLTSHVEVWTGKNLAKVSSFYYGGKKPTCKVTTRNGYQLEGTLPHPLRVRLGTEEESWVKLESLGIGDYLCVDRSGVPFPLVEPVINFDPGKYHHSTVRFSQPSRLTPDLSTLLGYVVAEGNRQYRGLTVTQDGCINPEPHREIRDLFFRVFGWSGNLKNKNRNLRIIVDSIWIRDFLKSCGVEEVTSHFKCVPDIVMRGTQQSVRNFLSSFIEAEGSVADGGVEVSSSSEKLIRVMQVLLLRFGVVSTLSKKRVKGYDHTYWKLTWFSEDARIFQREIGFRSTRKIQALLQQLDTYSNPNKNVVPYVSKLVRDLKAKVLDATSKRGANSNRKGSGLKQFGESFQSTLKHILKGSRNPTYQWLVSFLKIASSLGLSETEEYQAIEQIVKQNYFYDPIVSIELGEAEVMDIEVDDPDHCYVANGISSHNTLQNIAALCYIWEKEPTYKSMVVCPKSAIGQWASEFDKFTIGVKCFTASGTQKQRAEAYKSWYKCQEPAVLLVNYHGVVRDWNLGQAKEEPAPGSKFGTQTIAGRGLLDDLTSKVPNLAVTFDECVAFKTPSTKTHQTCKFLSEKAKRVWGLTATLLKNNLIEGFGIYQVIRPGTFRSKSAFLDAYCVTELQRIKGGAKIPIVVGYRNLDQFRKVIEPFFYGRPKHLVSDELPALTTKEVICEFSPLEDRKYAEALSGLLELGDGELRDYSDTKQLTSLIYAQEICDSIGLLKFDDGNEAFDGRSAKESALVDLIKEEFDGEKVIIYTRFAKMVPRLQRILLKEGIKSVAITGDVTKASERKKAQDLFQDLNSKVSVIFITDAGSEAINLQAASAMVFFDSPWSWGSYVQCLDTETEVLTKRGFQGVDSILESDLVSAMDPKTSLLHWVPIRSKMTRPLGEGEKMLSLVSQSLDIRVTEGHRMLFKRPTFKDRVHIWPEPWRFETAREMSNERSVYRIPISGFEAKEPLGLPFTDAELQFIGWFLTDGTFNKKTHQVYFTQAVHQPQIVDLRRCLKECGFDWKEYLKDPSKIKGCFPNGKMQVLFSVPKGTGRGSRKRNGWVKLERYLNKDFPLEFEELTSRQLGVLLEAIHLGDGDKQLGQSWTRRSYHIASVNSTFLARLQSLCVRRGFKCNVSKGPCCQILHIKKAQVASLMCRDQGRPGFIESPSISGEQVWCVENSLGTLVIRRNGKVAIVGNCLGRMIRIGSPHKGVLAIHMIAKRPGPKGPKTETLDHKVIQKLRKKKGMIDQVIGEAAVGALTFERGEGDLKDLLHSLREGIKA